MSSTAQATACARPDQSRSHVDRADTVLIAAISCSIALLHASAAVGHLSESALYFALFMALAIFQLAWGIAVGATATPRRLLLAGALANAGVVAVWVGSRTLGLPIGPDLGHPEAIGIPDLVATVDGVALILTSGVMLTRRGSLPGRVVATICLLIVVSLFAFLVFAHIG